MHEQVTFANNNTRSWLAIENLNQCTAVSSKVASNGSDSHSRLLSSKLSSQLSHEKVAVLSCRGPHNPQAWFHLFNTGKSRSNCRLWGIRQAYVKPAQEACYKGVNLSLRKESSRTVRRASSKWLKTLALVEKLLLQEPFGIKRRCLFPKYPRVEV